MKKGDQVWIKEPFWYKNEDLGGKSGIIISTKSYILLEIFGYHSNPVKCFRNEVYNQNKQSLKKK